MRSAALAALALAVAAPAGAQALVLIPLDSGTAVRLQIEAGPKITGRLLAPFAEDSTRFLYCPTLRGTCDGVKFSQRTTLAANVSRVEMQTGTRATRGAFMGAGIALGTALAACTLIDDLGCDPTNGSFFTYVALPVGFLGAGIGALIGGTVPKWSVAP